MYEMAGLFKGLSGMGNGQIFLKNQSASLKKTNGMSIIHLAALLDHTLRLKRKMSYGILVCMFSCFLIITQPLQLLILQTPCLSIGQPLFI
jgi:hypothetical protein